MSVVGKYRYLMDSAASRGHLPVIVDIFLVCLTPLDTRTAVCLCLSVLLSMLLSDSCLTVSSPNSAQTARGLSCVPIAHLCGE